MPALSVGSSFAAGNRAVTMISKHSGIFDSGVLRFLPEASCLTHASICDPLASGPQALRSSHRLAALGVSCLSCELLARLTARLHFFLKEMLDLHPESLRDVPQTYDCWISLAQFQPADIGAINAHPLGKRGLG